MKLNFEFKEEEVYDDKANVTFSRLSENNREILAQIDKKNEDIPDLMDIIVGIHTSDGDKEMTNINRLGGNETDYVRNCRRIWDRLWKYFGVDSYRKKCFPPEEKGLLITSDEKKFLEGLFKDASFLDGRVIVLSNNEKEKIQKAATNLYQIIRRRINITEEIRGKFFEATKDKSYIREKRFDDINDSINEAKKWAYDDSGDNCLNIKEKELWAEKLADELKDVIDKWVSVYKTMNSLKSTDKDRYRGITKPECLIEDAIADGKGVEVK